MKISVIAFSKMSSERPHPFIPFGSKDQFFSMSYVPQGIEKWFSIWCGIDIHYSYSHLNQIFAFFENIIIHFSWSTYSFKWMEFAYWRTTTRPSLFKWINITISIFADDRTHTSNQNTSIWTCYPSATAFQFVTHIILLFAVNTSMCVYKTWIRRIVCCACMSLLFPFISYVMNKRRIGRKKKKIVCVNNLFHDSNNDT